MQSSGSALEFRRLDALRAHDQDRTGDLILTINHRTVKLRIDASGSDEARDMRRLVEEADSGTAVGEGTEDCYQSCAVGASPIAEPCILEDATNPAGPCLTSCA